MAKYFGILFLFRRHLYQTKTNKALSKLTRYIFLKSQVIYELRVRSTSLTDKLSFMGLYAVKSASEMLLVGKSKLVTVLDSPTEECNIESKG